MTKQDNPPIYLSNLLVQTTIIQNTLGYFKLNFSYNIKQKTCNKSVTFIKKGHETFPKNTLTTPYFWKFFDNIIPMKYRINTKINS